MRKQQEHWFIKILRILLGCVFIFSGFTKAIDPVASAIQFNDYFVSFGMGFLQPISMFCGVCMNIVEFTLGFMMLFRIRIKFTALIYLLFMVFFFFLTLWLAIAEHLEVHYGYDFGVVKDCGCFGKAVKMSNLQTFLKNVGIIIPTFIIFAKRKSIPDIRLTILGQWLFAFVGALIVIFIQWHCYRHLPWIDFSDWKIGNNVEQIYVDKPAQHANLYVYRSNATDSTLFLTEEELMAMYDKDPNFATNFVYEDCIDSTISELVRAEIPGFTLVDTAGGEHAYELINAESNVPVFLVFMHDLNDVNLDGLNSTALQELITNRDTVGYKVVGITNSSEAEIANFVEKNGVAFPIYHNTIDPIKGPFIVRDAVHSNPGMILVHRGIVIDKWAWRDFPSQLPVQE